MGVPSINIAEDVEGISESGGVINSAVWEVAGGDVNKLVFVIGDDVEGISESGGVINSAVWEVAGGDVSGGDVIWDVGAMCLKHKVQNFKYSIET